MKNKTLKKIIFYIFYLFFICLLFFSNSTGQQNILEISDSKKAFIDQGVILPSFVQNGKFYTILFFDNNINRITINQTDFEIIENGDFKFTFFAMPLNYKKGYVDITIYKINSKSEIKIPILEKDPYPKTDIILSPSKQEIVSDTNAAKREEETKFFNNLLSQKSKIRFFTLPFENPLDVMKIISVFGNSRVYKDTSGNVLYTSVHLGVDLKASENTKVYAISGAKVAFAGYSITRGYCVYLDHGYGLFSSYFHLNKILVEQNQIIKAKDLIGLSGSTGISTGPHLHLGAVLNAMSIDPISLIKEMNELEQDFNKVSNRLK